MRSSKVMLFLAAAASVGAIAAAPASATTAPSGLTLWSGAFTGQTVTYADPGTGCTVLPFTVHAQFNDTAKTIQVYSTADCTGWSLTFPASDFHSFIGFDGRSFRATG